MSKSRPSLPRHQRIAAEGVAQHAGAERRHEGEAQGARESREAARRQDAGDDLRTSLDPHAGVVRRRHAPARRRIHHADRRGDAARPRRDHRRHRARAVALCRCDHDPHPQPRCAAGTGRACHRARDQRADAALASLPGDGRPDDLRGASRADRGQAPWPGPATTTTCWRRGRMRRSVSSSSSMSRPRRSSRRTRR